MYVQYHRPGKVYFQISSVYFHEVIVMSIFLLVEVPATCYFIFAGKRHTSDIFTKVLIFDFEFSFVTSIFLMVEIPASSLICTGVQEYQYLWSVFLLVALPASLIIYTGVQEYQ